MNGIESKNGGMSPENGPGEAPREQPTDQDISRCVEPPTVSWTTGLGNDASDERMADLALVSMGLYQEWEPGEVAGSFEQWLELPISDDFDASCAAQCTKFREAMNNDLALWDTRPFDYINTDESDIQAGFAFWPDYFDWARLRATSREAWHNVVQEYYELRYRSACGHAENGRHHYTALTWGWPATDAAMSRLWNAWCPCQNPLYDRRLRLHPR